MAFDRHLSRVTLNGTSMARALAIFPIRFQIAGRRPIGRSESVGKVTEKTGGCSKIAFGFSTSNGSYSPAAVLTNRRVVPRAWNYHLSSVKCGFSSFLLRRSWSYHSWTLISVPLELIVATPPSLSPTDNSLQLGASAAQFTTSFEFSSLASTKLQLELTRTGTASSGYHPGILSDSSFNNSAASPGLGLVKHNPTNFSYITC
ncbi:hypothetical protein GE21DRAFT_1019747 [Neurospora crassa]|nr:hypothetical protein GE21DRAFT_1019747 [Neurospora crassa]